MIFARIAVYPKGTSLTLVSWEFQSGELAQIPAGPYTLYLEFSRSGSDEWNVVNSVDNYDFNQIEIYDTGQRAWAVNETIFYRIRITNGTDTFTSHAEPSWGSPDRNDRLKIREMMRQECLRLRKFVGSRGLLYKRKQWGESPNTSETTANVVDPDTGAIIDVNAIESLGTAFKGGYYVPVVYWLEFQVGETQKIERDETTGTKDIVTVNATGLAYPFPRSNDVWVDCTSGKRYIINACVVKSKVRHLPITYQITMSEVPPTDIIYKIGEIEATPGTNMSEPPELSPYTQGNGFTWRGEVQ